MITINTTDHDKAIRVRIDDKAIVFALPSEPYYSEHRRLIAAVVDKINEALQRLQT
jgi:hypothetical protein